MKHIKLFENFLNEADKFTFKTTKSTGRYRSFYSDSHDIKLKGNNVGNIQDEKPFKIKLMVMKNEAKGITDNNPNCPWKWITLKKESESLEEAKTWINSVIEQIQKQYELKKI